jgi:hypothetical protein
VSFAAITLCVASQQVFVVVVVVVVVDFVIDSVQKLLDTPSYRRKSANSTMQMVADGLRTQTVFNI